MPSQTATPQTRPEDRQAGNGSGTGWYLYGLTTRQSAANLPTGLATETGERVQALEQGELAAFVRPVLLAEFSAEVLRARAQDLTWLEAMVRSHHQIVERMHQAGAVLPVKFGAVYPDNAALLAALAERHDALLAQLQRLEGCDEWGINLYADPQVVQRLCNEQPKLQRLKADLTAASPGRAYLLKRKLADELAGIEEEALNELAQTSYERLAHEAVAGQISPRAQTPANSSGEREVLHAAFLVPRAIVEPFLGAVQRLEAEQTGLRCACSGPWPPYSFAQLVGEGAP